MSRIACALLLAVALAAAEERPTVVYVPYDHVPDIDPAKQGVFIPYDQFLALWTHADRGGDHPEPGTGAALDVVTLAGRVAGDVAELTVQGEVTALAKGWSTVELPPTLALTSFKPSDPRMALERTADRLVLHLPVAGHWSFTAACAAPVGRDAAGRRGFTLAVPAAGVARLDLTVPETEAVVALEPAVAATQASGKDGTRVQAVIGGAGSLAVAWQPPAKEPTGEPLIIAASDVRATVAERSLRYDAAIELTVLRRPTDSIALQLPPECEVIEVQGRGVRTWDRDGERLTVRLLEPLDGKVTLRLRLERALPAQAAGETRALALPLPTVAGAARATGELVVVPGEGYALSVAGHDGLSQVDPAELPADFAAAASAAFRFSAPPPPLALQATRLRPDLRVQAAQLVRLGRDEDQATVVAELEVRKAGLFSLVASVPAPWRLVDVSGLAVEDQRPVTIGEGRDALTGIELTLRGRLLGNAGLVLHLRRPGSLAGDAPGEVPVPVVSFADTGRAGQAATVEQRGTIAVAAPREWALAASARDGLSAADAAPLRREGPLAAAATQLGANDDLALAFTYLEPTAVLRLTTQRRSRELTARELDLVTVADGNLHRQVTWTGEVRYAALDRLRVTAPTALDAALTFRHPNLAERQVVSRTDGESTWELRFQPPLAGAFTLAAEYLQDLPTLGADKPAPFTVQPLRLAEESHVTYVAAVAREGSIEVAASAALDHLPAGDLPAGLQAAGVAAAFQGPQPAPIALTLVRHDLLPLVDAAIGEVRYLLALSEEGVLRVEGHLRVADRGRPFLELALPPGAELLELAVDGRQARPTRRADGSGIVVRLAEREAAHQQTLAFVYEERHLTGALGVAGALAIHLPMLGGGAAPAVPVERCRAWLMLPSRLLPYAWRGDVHTELGDDGWSSSPRLGSPERPADDGLTVHVPAIEVAYLLSRDGDGGELHLRWLSRGARDVSALIALAVGAAAAWAARRRARIRLALAVVAAVAALAAGGAWLPVAVAGLVGVVAVLAVDAVRAIGRAWIAARRERRSLPDPWLEAATAPPPPAPPTSEGEPPTEPKP